MLCYCLECHTYYPEIKSHTTLVWHFLWYPLTDTLRNLYYWQYIIYMIVYNVASTPIAGHATPPRLRILCVSSTAPGSATRGLFFLTGNIEMLMLGAGGENRTLIVCLEGRHISHYTTPACPTIIPVIVRIWKVGYDISSRRLSVTISLWLR